MLFLETLAVTLLVVSLLRPLIRKVPWAFYLLCIAFDVVLIALAAGALPHWANLIAIPLLRRGFIAISLFVIVMYIGVFPYGSRIRNYYAPIRAVLSICACILALGHICMYFTAYIPKVLAGNQTVPISVAMIAGLLLLVLLLVLGITSFGAVRKAMGGARWLKLQKAAYVFYALIYIHAACLLLPPALQGGSSAQISIAVYTLVFGVYAIARIARGITNKRDKRSAELRQHELDTQAV